jgi:hypothetical protein
VGSQIFYNNNNNASTLCNSEQDHNPRLPGTDADQCNANQVQPSSYGCSTCLKLICYHNRDAPACPAPLTTNGTDVPSDGVLSENLLIHPLFSDGWTVDYSRNAQFDGDAVAVQPAQRTKGVVFNYQDHAPMQPATTYTVKVWARTTAASASVNAYTCTNYNFGRLELPFQSILQNEWIQLVFVFTNPLESECQQVSFRYADVVGNERLWLTAPTMVKGNSTGKEDDAESNLLTETNFTDPASGWYEKLDLSQQRLGGYVENVTKDEIDGPIAAGAGFDVVGMSTMSSGVRLRQPVLQDNAFKSVIAGGSYVFSMKVQAPVNSGCDALPHASVYLLVCGIASEIFEIKGGDGWVDIQFEFTLPKAGGCRYVRTNDMMNIQVLGIQSSITLKRPLLQRTIADSGCCTGIFVGHWCPYTCGLTFSQQAMIERVQGEIYYNGSATGVGNGGYQQTCPGYLVCAGEKIFGDATKQGCALKAAIDNGGRHRDARPLNIASATLEEVPWISTVHECGTGRIASPAQCTTYAARGGVEHENITNMANLKGSTSYIMAIRIKTTPGDTGTLQIRPTTGLHDYFDFKNASFAESDGSSRLEWLFTTPASAVILSPDKGSCPCGELTEQECRAFGTGNGQCFGEAGNWDYVPSGCVLQIEVGGVASGRTTSPWKAAGRDSCTECHEGVGCDWGKDDVAFNNHGVGRVRPDMYSRICKSCAGTTTHTITFDVVRSEIDSEPLRFWMGAPELFEVNVSTSTSMGDKGVPVDEATCHEYAKSIGMPTLVKSSCPDTTPKQAWNYWRVLNAGDISFNGVPLVTEWKLFPSGHNGICSGERITDFRSATGPKRPSCVFHENSVWAMCNGKLWKEWGVGPEGKDEAMGNCQYTQSTSGNMCPIVAEDATFLCSGVYGGNNAAMGCHWVHDNKTDPDQSLIINGIDYSAYTGAWRPQCEGCKVKEAWIGVHFDEPVYVGCMELLGRDGTPGHGLGASGPFTSRGIPGVPWVGGLAVEVSDDGENWQEVDIEAQTFNKECLACNLNTAVVLDGNFTCAPRGCYSHGVDKPKDGDAAIYWNDDKDGPCTATSACYSFEYVGPNLFIAPDLDITGVWDSSTFEYKYFKDVKVGIWYDRPLGCFR